MCKQVDSRTKILDTDFQMVPSILPESVRLLPDCCIGTLVQGWKWLERFLRVFHTELGTVVTPGGTNCCRLQFRRSRVWVLWDICFLLTWHFRCDDLVGGWWLVQQDRKERSPMLYQNFNEQLMVAKKDTSLSILILAIFIGYFYLSVELRQKKVELMKHEGTILQCNQYLITA